MNFTSIEYFFFVVEEGGFSAAARKLLISQQTLSVHIQKLESWVGTPVFKRTQPLSLTQAGEILFQNGKTLLALRDKMVSDVKDIADQQEKTLSIGVPLHETYLFLSELLVAFERENPEYRVSITKRFVNGIGDNIRGIDLFFSQFPLDEKLTHIPIIKDDVFAVFVRQSLLDDIYGPRWVEIEERLIETKDISLLSEVPFIMLFDRWGHNAAYLDLILKGAKFSPRISFSSESGELNYAMCAKGIGAYIASYSLGRKKMSILSGDKELRAFPIEVHNVKSVVALSYERGKKLSLTESKFIQKTIDYLRKSDIGAIPEAGGDN